MRETQTHRHTLRRHTVAIAAAAALTITGCGSSNNDDSSVTATSGPATATTDAVADSSTTTAAVSTTSAAEAMIVVTQPPAPTTMVATTLPAPTTSAPTTVPATTVPPVDYGQQYLNWVAPLNCANQRTYDAERVMMGDDNQFTYEEWPALQPQLNSIYNDSLRAAVAFIETGAQLDWPADIQVDIDAVIADVAADGEAYRMLSTATTIDQWNAGIDALAAGGTSSAAIVRSKLGLESNLTLEVVCD